MGFIGGRRNFFGRRTLRGGFSRALPPTSNIRVLAFEFRLDFAAFGLGLMDLRLREGALLLDFLGQPLLGVHSEPVGDLLRPFNSRHARQFGLKINWLRHQRLPGGNPPPTGPMGLDDALHRFSKLFYGGAVYLADARFRHFEHNADFLKR